MIYGGSPSRFACRGRGLWNYHSMRIENQGTCSIGSALQRNPLAVERYFDCTRVACPKNNLINSTNRLHVGRTDDAAYRYFAVALDRYPGMIFGAYGYLKRLTELAQQSLSGSWWRICDNTRDGLCAAQWVFRRQ